MDSISFSMKSKVILEATGNDGITSDLFSPSSKNNGDTKLAGVNEVSLIADRIDSDFLFLLGLLNMTVFLNEAQISSNFIGIISNYHPFYANITKD